MLQYYVSIKINAYNLAICSSDIVYKGDYPLIQDKFQGISFPSENKSTFTSKHHSNCFGVLVIHFPHAI